MTNTKLRCIFCLLAISSVMSDRFVDRRRINGTMESKKIVKHKGTVKTIQGNNGDVIDCVDIYQQPAFDHPLLKNHTIQMEPSSIPNVTNEEFYDAELFQDLLENEECPEGTIPIRHAREYEYYPHRAVPPTARARRKNLNIRVDYDNTGHEYAVVSLSNGNYHGASAFINVWNPTINDGEFSDAQIWLAAGPSDHVNTIEAGWIVDWPNKEPKFFVEWTADGYNTTGCPNLHCPGFVQVNRRFVLGTPLKSISSYNAAQFSIGISIYENNGNWWLQVKGKVLGYWPSSIFTDLKTSASSITWGGEIYDSGQQPHHTTTQMGSGHFPSEGFKKASYFRNIQYMDNLGKFIDPDTRLLAASATKTGCYDMRVALHDGNFGTHFYFGGPGYSAICP